jgi:uncharacterized ubiquitin-like protein YukD
MDMELPCNIPVSELKMQLAEALKETSYSYMNWDGGVRLQYNGSYLKNERSLSNYGVWDGSFLKVIPEVQNGTY